MDWIDLIFVVGGIVLNIIGLIGCFIPVLPGPPISYISILLLHFFTGYQYSEDFLITWFFITAIVTVLDYVVPVLGAKKMGGSNYGVWGAVLGLIIGLFFPPIGIIVGPFFGAWCGELIAGKTGSEAIKAAIGSFLGFLVGTILKLITSCILFYHFIAILFG